MHNESNKTQNAKKTSPTQISCVFGAGIRSCLCCAKKLSNTPALQPGCPERAGAESWHKAQCGRHRGLAELTARGSRAPGRQVPISLHRLHLCHPALMQQPLRVRAWQKEIPTMVLSQCMPNQGYYSGAVDFWCDLLLYLKADALTTTTDKGLKARTSLERS